MTMLQDIRCKFGWHAWGPVTGDIARAHHQCTHCGKVGSVDTGRPLDARDISSRWPGSGHGLV